MSQQKKVERVLQEAMRQLQTELPKGLHFAIIVEVPPEGGAAHGAHAHVTAISTDRERMAFAAAQWSLEVLPPPQSSRN